MSKVPVLDTPKPRMTATEAGRLGGRSHSAAKVAACKRNGFQKQEPPTTITTRSFRDGLVQLLAAFPDGHE
jgi:hypothetical protein